MEERAYFYSVPIFVVSETEPRIFCMSRSPLSKLQSQASLFKSCTLFEPGSHYGALDAGSRNLHRPGCPETQRDSSAPASEVLGSKLCINALSHVL